MILVVLSFHVPANGAVPDGPSEVGQNGLKFLLIPGSPLVAVGVVGVLLGRYSSSGSRPALVIAWIVAGAALAISVVGILTIGPLLLPVAALLAGATASAGSPPSQPDPGPAGERNAGQGPARGGREPRPL